MMIERLRVDSVAAIRALTSTPATALAGVLTLAVAVGINLAMFGLIDRAIFSPPAHGAAPDRVFTLTFEPVGDDSRRIRMTTTSYPAFEALRKQVAAAADVAALHRLATSAVVDGTQIRVEAMLVSGGYFRLLGVRPHLGRGIEPGDDGEAGGSAPAVLSHAFWVGMLGGDPRVLGRRVTIRGLEFTVAGVMPAGFSGHSAARLDVWVPFAAAMQQSPGWDTDRLRNIAAIVMRLKQGENPAAAEAQASEAVDRTVSLSPIRGAEVAPTEQQIAYWLTGVSVLVLIIGLANTATLLLVRGAGRRRDLAIRTALGATRARLVAQVLIEAALLAFIAVGVALILAYWFDEAVRRVLLPSIAESSGTSLRVLGGAALAGVAALAVAGAAAAVHVPSYFRAEDVAGVGPGRSRRRAYTALLLMQTTLSVALLAGAGLFGRSLFNLITQDFGMRMKDVLLVEFDQGPGSIPGQDELFKSALDRIRNLPGVERATVVATLPFAGRHVLPVGIPGQSASPSVDGQLPFLNAATPEFLEILEVQIVKGRRFTDADERGAPVVIVNETMARTVWPDGSAVGKCIRVGFDPSFDPFTATGPPGPPMTTPCREVVGVARDVRQRSLVPSGIEGRLMQYFVPFSQVPPPPAGIAGGPRVHGLLVRTSADTETVAAPIRHLIVQGRTDLPFVQVRPYSDLLEREMRPWRLGTVLLSLFGALALGVAAVGLYAVFAHAVVQRRREMAIRIAIGAKPGGVLAMILREATGIAAAGVLCGGALTLVAGRWLEAMLFATAPSDPVVLGSAAVLMVVVAAVATYIPARSASRTNATSLLRAE